MGRGLKNLAVNLLLSDVILTEHADEAYSHATKVRVFQSLPGMDQVRKIRVWNRAILERSHLLLKLAYDADW